MAWLTTWHDLPRFNVLRALSEYTRSDKRNPLVNYNYKLLYEKPAIFKLNFTVSVATNLRHNVARKWSTDMLVKILIDWLINWLMSTFLQDVFEIVVHADNSIFYQFPNVIIGEIFVHQFLAQYFEIERTFGLLLFILSDGKLVIKKNTDFQSQFSKFLRTWAT